MTVLITAIEVEMQTKPNLLQHIAKLRSPKQHIKQEELVDLVKKETFESAEWGEIKWI